jgi:hypothetical protein
MFRLFYVDRHIEVAEREKELAYAHKCVEFEIKGILTHAFSIVFALSCQLFGQI